MKVIEVRKDNRTGETLEVSWGNKIESDFSIIGSVVSIMKGHREHLSARFEATHNPILDRFTTVAVRIEL
jgi:hypothetical protein